jgi:hypothetical protein
LYHAPTIPVPTVPVVCQGAVARSWTTGPIRFGVARGMQKQGIKTCQQHSTRCMLPWDRVSPMQRAKRKRELKRKTALLQACRGKVTNLRELVARLQMSAGSSRSRSPLGKHASGSPRGRNSSSSSSGGAFVIVPATGASRRLNAEEGRRDEMLARYDEILERADRMRKGKMKA